MKILYAIQGTGNGHLSRAMDIIPCLQKRGEVDILVSGIQGDLQLPYEVKYREMGLSFIFGKSGGVDLWKTFTRSNLRKLAGSIYRLPVQDYDIVINDFEPVSAWACRIKRKPCIALSHQAAVLLKNYPQPEKPDKLGRYILKNYAPASTVYGFHFSSIVDTVSTPVIRQQVRQLEISDKGHYTVYLPSYDDKKLIKKLSVYTDTKWDIFSKYNKKKMIFGNITIQPINNSLFTASMASATGILCGAGFETPAEALYLGKKLLVIPMKNQYEQQLNAAALQSMNVPVLKNLNRTSEPVISDWIANGVPLQIHFPDITQQVVDRVILNHAPTAIL
ncbi:MAG TPA: glycosyltransferase family protein [Flavobacterium sp.]|jgi:uncharacterized protein (TIGR00661 family)